MVKAKKSEAIGETSGFDTLESIPPELLRELARSLKLLNDALICENDGLKSENIALQKMSDIQEKRIAVLEKGVHTLEEGGTTRGLVEKVVSKTQSQFLERAKVHISPKLINAGMQAQKVMSGKNARQSRSDDDAKIKAKALKLYDAGVWKSIAEAAEKIFPEVNQYALSLNDGVVKKVKARSAARFQKTLGEWLTDRKRESEMDANALAVTANT